MLLKSSTVAIGFLLSIFAAAPFFKHNLVPAPASPASGLTNPILLKPGPGKARLMKVPAGSLSVPSQTVAIINSVPLDPGVYTTQPFACIVAVPPEHLDGSIAVSPTEGASNMPTLNPELHFIPLDPK